MQSVRILEIDAMEEDKATTLWIES